jgi:hypothetical protein
LPLSQHMISSPFESILGAFDHDLSCFLQSHRPKASLDILDHFILMNYGRCLSLLKLLENSLRGLEFSF